MVGTNIKLLVSAGSTKVKAIEAQPQISEFNKIGQQAGVKVTDIDCETCV